MSKELKTRDQIPQELTWDVSRLYKDQEACRADLAAALKLANDFSERFEGHLHQGGSLLSEAIKAYEAIDKKLDRTLTYASLLASVDLTNNEYVALNQEAGMKAAEIGSLLSFWAVELAALPEETLQQAIRENPTYAIYLGDIKAWKAHQLSAKEEALLAALEPSLDLPSTLYETTKAADMRFPELNLKDGRHPLSYVLYENEYCGSPDTDLRRESFRAFSETLRKYQETTAAIYNGQIQKEKILSRQRGFDSVIDYLLFHQKVPRKLYERQLDITMEKLAPVMRRWAKLLQQAHHLEEMHYSDLKLSLDPTIPPQISVEDSQQYIREAMEPMGKEYQAMIMRAFPERWFDFAQNIGKQTGGYCTVPVDAGPFILLNWTGGIDEVYTMAHELGHAAQGLLCLKSNSLLQSDFSWYDVESPSTFHEMLLSHSLMKRAKTPDEKKKVCAQMIEKTYYHNFVTHFLEGYYQREVYRLVDQGQNLRADDLNRLFRETLEKFWGESVILDEGAELTWMRQPHYYNGLYSYTYSASLTISTEMYRRVQKEGEAVVGDWLKFLSAGGPIPPIEHARLAGIDIEDGSALERTIAFISDLVSQLEA